MSAWQHRHWSFSSIYRGAAAAAVTCAGVVLASCASTGSLGPLDLSDQEVEERIRMHRGDWWTFENYEPPDKQELREDIIELLAMHFVGKQIALNEGFIESRTDPFRVQLHLVNNGLMCISTNPAKPEVSVCRANDVVKVDPAGDKRLAECLKNVGGTTTNLVGAFTATTTLSGKREPRYYCLRVTLVETKKRPEGAVQWPSSPTRIQKDQIVFTILPEDGNAGPGTIVGGPRPQFSRAPQG